jgi:hydrogenase nickel incorporation protein HypA/HybF
MHELSIAQEMVEICLQNADGQPINSVTLLIGSLSGVVPEALEFCFEACTRETLLEGAELRIEQVPATGRCSGCLLEFALDDYFSPCPSCGSYQVTLLSGDEMRVKEMEVA